MAEQRSIKSAGGKGRKEMVGEIHMYDACMMHVNNERARTPAMGVHILA